MYSRLVRWHRRRTITRDPLATAIHRYITDRPPDVRTDAYLQWWFGRISHLRVRVALAKLLALAMVEYVWQADMDVHVWQAKGRHREPQGTT